MINHLAANAELYSTTDLTNISRDLFFNLFKKYYSDIEIAFENSSNGLTVNIEEYFWIHISYTKFVSSYCMFLIFIM